MVRIVARSRLRRLGWMLLGLHVLVGCAHGASGTLGPDYFKHNESGYELIYVGKGPEQGLGPGWRLDNYVERPARGGRMAYFVREGKEYGFDRRYDFDGDALPDHSVRRALYDLRYTQEAGPGVIWTRSIILAASLENKPLDVLAQRYVSKVPRVGAVFPHFGEGLPTAVAEPRYEVEVLEKHAHCEVASVPASRIDFELRGEGETQRVSVVLMRPGYRHTLLANGKTHSYEVVLLAAYSNTPVGFEAAEPAFDALLDHLSLAQGQHPHSCRDAGAGAEAQGAQAASAALEGTPEAVRDVPPPSPPSPSQPTEPAPAPASGPAPKGE